MGPPLSACQPHSRARSFSLCPWAPPIGAPPPARCSRRRQLVDALTQPGSPLPFLQLPVYAGRTHVDVVVPTTCVELRTAHAACSFEHPVASFSPSDLISLTSTAQNHRTAPKPSSRRHVVPHPTRPGAPPTSVPRRPSSKHKVVRPAECFHTINPPTTELDVSARVSIPLTSPLSFFPASPSLRPSGQAAVPLAVP